MKNEKNAELNEKEMKQVAGGGRFASGMVEEEPVLGVPRFASGVVDEEPVLGAPRFASAVDNTKNQLRGG